MRIKSFNATCGHAEGLNKLVFVSSRLFDLCCSACVDVTFLMLDEFSFSLCQMSAATLAW